MKTNKFGQHILAEAELCDLIMQGRDVTQLRDVTVDPGVCLESMIQHLEHPNNVLTWTFPEHCDIAVPEFDRRNQAEWFMPDHYQTLDIAQHVLSLCQTPEQLQRAGEELLLYQQHDLFDLLRYLHYLVDIMRANQVIWGVGRGSSVASYVLYLLGVHRIDSLYYDLDPCEFLR